MHGIHGALSPQEGLVAAPPQPRLVRAAHEFEAQMMKEMLKPLTSSGSLNSDEDEAEASGSSGALGEFASETLGRALSEAGGLGIANSILKDLSQPGNDAESERMNVKTRKDTTVRRGD